MSYVSLQPEGLKPDVLFCYDLELPPDFVPTPQDGEVSEFVLWDVAAVAACIARGGEYKPNCGIVILDFFVRHGLLTPDQVGCVCFYVCVFSVCLCAFLLVCVRAACCVLRPL